METTKELESEMTMSQVIKELQDHEGRITASEKNIEFLKENFSEIKNLIKEGNTEQLARLKTMDDRLMKEFFHKQRTTHETKMSFWLKLGGGLVGGGSFVYVIVDAVVSKLM